ncbi:tail fiber domain-containing protein [Klebsiella aerogenes]|uniref:tail fiber domain-containing protein n=1 Tax=Klebsiella aerogenes TaxID=548 RepID=UPI00063CA392|nr:tail fiber domain-containing protein [Klebsiella aerogenes]EIV3799622.1 tail fiber domain-containing protein [Klebsiella aerogenes]EIV7211163.1 tail fiber domain-containing protein [Klebsiella aerogenes]EKZ5298650.1 tail fiber domain-containing protein [Klebsiella aerogenes]EMC9819525.1 tail fiber domain-containing protein [Klebsiella aerogenes]KLF23639.1 tail fiber [Klebsiella aerogenes]
MATISDELAASIQKCFDRTYIDLANQQQFLFGAGNVTITKPDGTTGTVKSWEQFLSEYATRQQNIDTALKDVAKTTVANMWTQAQTWNVSSTFKNNLTVDKNLTVNGNLNGVQIAGSHIELTAPTPYIDFHHGNSSADFTHRIITEDGALAIYPGLRVRGNTGLYGAVTLYGDLWWGYTATRTTDPVNPSNGTILTSPNMCWRFFTRGQDSKGATAGMATAWFEEQVGTNHRLTFSVQGFNANQQWWSFYSDGRIASSQNGNVQFQGTSDARMKHDIKPTDGQLSVDRIRALELVTFVYNDDEQERTRRGIIAQQAQEVDSQYVKNVAMSYMKDGEQLNFDRLQLDNNVIMMDMLAAVNVLIKRVDELEEKLAILEIQ